MNKRTLVMAVGMGSILLVAVVTGLLSAAFGGPFLAPVLMALFFTIVGAQIMAGVVQAMNNIDAHRNRQGVVTNTARASGYDHWLEEQDRRHGL